MKFCLNWIYWPLQHFVQFIFHKKWHFIQWKKTLRKPYRKMTFACLVIQFFTELGPALPQLVSVIFGLLEFFNPVASRSKYTHILLLLSKMVYNSFNHRLLSLFLYWCLPFLIFKLACSYVASPDLKCWDVAVWPVSAHLLYWQQWGRRKGDTRGDMKGATVMILIWTTFLLMIIMLFLWTCLKRNRKKNSKYPTR